MSSLSRAQFLAHAFSLTWRVPCPLSLPANTPLGVAAGGTLERQRAAALLAWPTGTAPRAEPLVRYAAGLVAAARTAPALKELRTEMAHTLHALAHIYQGLADRADDPYDFAFATARAAHLATDTCIAHNLPVPWEQALPVVLDTHAAVVHAHSQLDTPTVAARAAVVLYERALLAHARADHPLTDLVLRTGLAHWQSALLSLTAPALPTFDEQAALSAAFVQKQFDTCVRHHAAAAARLDEAEKALGQHRGASLAPAGKAVMTALRQRAVRAASDAERVRNADDARKTAIGAYIDDAGAGAAPGVLDQAALILPEVPGYAAVERDHQYHLDLLLQTEADSWAPVLVGDAGATTAPPAAAAPVRRSLTSVMAQVLGVAEHVLVRTSTPRTHETWRVALTAALLQQRRQYAAGYGGPDRLHLIQRIDAATQKLLGV